MRKVYGYARFYSDKEVKEEFNHLVCCLVSVGADEIITESTPISSAKSPKLKQLLETAAPGSTIMCPELNRLCASSRMLCEVVSSIQQKHMCLFIPQKILLDFRTGTGDSAAQAFVNTCNVILELDRACTREMIRTGMQLARAQGKHIGRKPTTVNDIPSTFISHLPDLQNHTLNISQLARACNLSRPTVYKYLNLIGHNLKA